MPEHLSKADQVRYFLNRVEDRCCQEEENWSPISDASGLIDKTAENEFDLVEARTTLETFLSFLGERENLIIRCRFLNDLILEQTGHQVNLTKERARQIQGEALRKLRRVVSTFEKNGRNAR